MANDIATLGLKAEYDSVKDASEALDDLSSSAEGAEKKVGLFSSETKAADKIAGGLAGTSNKLGGALDKVASSALGGGKQISFFSSMSGGALAAVAGLAAAIVGVTGALVSGIRSTVQYANSLSYTANMLGVNKQALQEMRFAAEQSGIATDKFDVALRRFIRRSSEAAMGTGAAKDAFKELGVALTDENGALKDSDTLLKEVADAMTGVEDPASRLRLAFKMFDTDGAAMLNLLENGSQGMEELREQARSLGIVLSDDVIAASKAITDSWSLFGYAMQGLTSTLTTVFAPVLVVISHGLTALAKGLSTLVRYLPTVAEYAAVAAGTLALIASPILLGAIGSLTTAIGTGLVTALRTMGAALLANPLFLLATVLVGVVAAVYHFRDEIKKAIGVDVVEIAKKATNYVINAFRAAFEDIKFIWENFGDIVSAPIIAGANIAIRTINDLVDKAIKQINSLIKLVNKIPRVDIQLLERGAGISEIENKAAKRLSTALDTHNAKIKEIMSSDPLGGLGDAFVIATSKAEEFVTTLVDVETELNTLGGGGGGGSGGGGGGGGAADSAAEQLRTELEGRLQALRDYYAREDEMIEARRIEQLETLQLAREAEMLSQQEYNEYKLMVERDFQYQMAEMRAQQYAAALNATGDLFGAMASMTASGNDRMLKMQKIAGAAAALVSTLVGAAKALELPFPANLAAAATVMARGMALVSAIKSGSKSGGGGGGRSTSVSAAPQEPERPMQQAVELKMHGEVFSRDTVAELIDKINDMSEDGYNLIVRTE